MILETTTDDQVRVAWERGHVTGVVPVGVTIPVVSTDSALALVLLRTMSLCLTTDGGSQLVLDESDLPPDDSVNALPAHARLVQ